VCVVCLWGSLCVLCVCGALLCVLCVCGALCVCCVFVGLFVCVVCLWGSFCVLCVCRSLYRRRAHTHKHTYCTHTHTDIFCTYCVCLWVSLHVVCVCGSHYWRPAHTHIQRPTNTQKRPPPKHTRKKPHGPTQPCAPQTYL